MDSHWGKTANPSLIFGIITSDSPSLTTALCGRIGLGVTDVGFCGSSHGCHYSYYLTAFIFFLSMLVGDHKNDSISILPRCVRCTLIQSIFYFLQTLLVTVQWGNWFPFQLNHRLYMHMYNMGRHKYDLRKLKWVKKVVLYHICS